MAAKLLPNSRKRFIVVSLVIALLVAIPALAVHDANLLELDGNIVDDTTPGGVELPTDWGDLFSSGTPGGTPLTLPAGAIASTFVHDGFFTASTGGHDGDQADTTTFSASKDDEDISGWNCASSNNPDDSSDIHHVYGVAFQPTSGSKAGHTLLYLGLERYAEGVGLVGFWILQGTASCTSGPFTGAHVDGDLFVVSEFTNGGVISSLKVYQWQSGALNTTAIATGVDCSSAAANDNVCAKVNTADVTTPWAMQAKQAAANTLEVSEFFELGLDITGLLPSFSGCFTTLLGETRSSSALNADLKDYAMGTLNTCGTVNIVKNTVPDSAQDFSFTHNITSDPTVTSPFSLDDDSDATLSNTKTFTKVPSGSYTVTEGANSDYTVSINCTGDSDNGSIVNNASRLVTIDVDPGENITCTFTNTAKPDLTALKTNNAGGTISVGQTFQWTVEVENNGPGTATFTNGQTILTDELPFGPTYGSTSVSPTGITGAANISCSIGSGTLTCSASGGSVVMPSGSFFTVTFNVTPTTTTSPLENPPADDGICRVDPGHDIVETNEGNNNCSNSVTVLAPDLTATKSNNTGGTNQVLVNGNFTWTIRVANGGLGTATFTNTQTILTDNLPSTNITYGAASITNSMSITGLANINCSISSNTLTCSATGNVVMPPSSFFDVSFTATPSAGGAFANPTGGICKVDPTGANGVIVESNEGNNACNNSVEALDTSIPDLVALKTNDTNSVVFIPNLFNWTIRVTNQGNANAVFAQNTLLLKDELPSGPTYGSPTVQNVSGTITGTISCAISSGTLTCSASGGSVTMPPSTSFEVKFQVTPSAAGTLNNPPATKICQADPDNVVNETFQQTTFENNNTCSNTVVVKSVNLKAQKTNNVSGAVLLGQFFNWQIEVTNAGPSTATFSQNAVLLSDTLPSGPTYQAGALTVANTGTGTINCSITTNVLTCTAGTQVDLDEEEKFTVSFSVTPAGIGRLVNPATTNGCKADPNNVVTENNENDNTCSNTVSVVAPVTCKCIHVWSRQAALTLKPGKVATINLNLFVQSGFAITITGITPRTGQPFEIVDISPNLPKTVPGFLGLQEFRMKVRLNASITTKTRIKRPFFDIASDPTCELLQEWSRRPKFRSETFGIIPFGLNATALTIEGNQLRLSALGTSIKSVQLQLFDLSGRTLIHQTQTGSTMSLPMQSDRGSLLANGMYLYVVRVFGQNGEVLTTEVRKLAVKR